MPKNNKKYEMFVFSHNLRVEELNHWTYAHILDLNQMSKYKSFSSNSLEELLEKMIDICFANQGFCKSWEEDDGAYIIGVPRITISNLGETNSNVEILYSTDIEYVFVSKTYIPQIVYVVRKTTRNKQSGETTTKEITLDMLSNC